MKAAVLTGAGEFDLAFPPAGAAHEFIAERRNVGEVALFPE